MPISQTAVMNGQVREMSIHGVAKADMLGGLVVRAWPLQRDKVIKGGTFGRRPCTILAFLLDVFSLSAQVLF